MHTRRERICGHFCNLTYILRTPNLGSMDIVSILKYIWNPTTSHYLLATSLSKPLSSLLLTGSVLPPLPAVQCAAARVNFKKWPDHVSSLFKTFHWLLISLRIKYKFPTEATRLDLIWPFLWPHITVLLTHPIPGALPTVLFLKYT